MIFNECVFLLSFLLLRKILAIVLCFLALCVNSHIFMLGHLRLSLCGCLLLFFHLFLCLDLLRIMCVIGVLGSFENSLRSSSKFSFSSCDIFACGAYDLQN